MPNKPMRPKLIEPKPRAGKAPLYEMRANYAKLADVALCLLHEADRLGLRVTQYELVKAVFFADRAHLNKYGRPVTWDRYVAMRHGPVAMTFYNMLMEDPEVLAKTGAPQWRWRPTGKNDIREFYGPVRPINMRRCLTVSDVMTLEAALVKVKALGFDGVWTVTHEDPAYLDAWEGNDEDGGFGMSFELLMDTPDREEAAQLSRYSQVHH